MESLQILKTLLIHGYCCGWNSAELVAAKFEEFDLYNV